MNKYNMSEKATLEKEKFKQEISMLSSSLVQLIRYQNFEFTFYVKGKLNLVHVEMFNAVYEDI